MYTRTRTHTHTHTHTGVISDVPLSPTKAKHSSSKKDSQVERDIAALRLTLVGEEVREAVTQPMKETVTAGKSLFDLGQRLVGWMVSSQVAASAA